MRRRQRGVVLVIALAILAGLVALVASVAASQQLSVRATANRVNHERARVAAQAGIQRAIAALADTIQDTSAAAAGPTSGTTNPGQAQMQTDEWFTLGDSGNERFAVGNATFRMQIVDAGSLVNINTALQQQLERLSLTTQQVAAILDWREVSTTPRTEGAKDDFYNALQKPYNAKLRRFDSVDELLDVRYFVPADLYQVTDNSSTAVVIPDLADGRQPVLADLITVDSYAQQLQPGGAAMINVGRGGATGPALVNRLRQAGLNQSATALQNGNFADMSAVINLVSQGELGPALDALTTSSTPRVEGRMNLNTVSEAALMSLPNMTQDLAQGIVNYQSTGFTKLSDLLQVSGFSDKNTLRQFAGSFTVRSSVFLIRVIGEAGDARVALEAVVDTSSNVPRLIKMHDQPFPDMPTRWGWSTEPTSDTVLVEAS
ncbi:hypothetical protein EON82_04690 [bacterium]|nr:MAG: hypothetical protein EON82_04690 [bacterium]